MQALDMMLQLNRQKQAAAVTLPHEEDESPYDVPFLVVNSSAITLEFPPVFSHLQGAVSDASCGQNES